MIILLSPAKSLDESPLTLGKETQAKLLGRTKELIKIMKTKSQADLMDLMSISEKLAVLNEQRYQSFSLPMPSDTSKAAGFLFTGDVYKGLDISTLDEDSLARTQDSVRILSGLYGVLRPFDAILPYRLEMGTALANDSGKNLYEFWGDSITDTLNEELEQNDIVLNLASNEYFKAINKKRLKGKLIDVAFKELRNGNYKVISFNAKKARGTMTRYIVKQDINTLEGLKAFDWDDYSYNEALSKENLITFTR